MALHTLGPKNGAVTCVSWRLSIGAAKDCKLAEGVVGRYTIFYLTVRLWARSVTVALMNGIPVDL